MALTERTRNALSELALAMETVLQAVREDLDEAPEGSEVAAFLDDAENVIMQIDPEVSGLIIAEDSLHVA